VAAGKICESGASAACRRGGFRKSGLPLSAARQICAKGRPTPRTGTIAQRRSSERLGRAQLRRDGRPRGSDGHNCAETVIREARTGTIAQSGSSERLGRAQLRRDGHPRGSDGHNCAETVIRRLGRDNCAERSSERLGRAQLRRVRSSERLGRAQLRRGWSSDGSDGHNCAETVIREARAGTIAQRRSSERLGGHNCAETSSDGSDGHIAQRSVIRRLGRASLRRSELVRRSAGRSCGSSVVWNVQEGQSNSGRPRRAEQWFFELGMTSRVRDIALREYPPVTSPPMLLVPVRWYEPAARVQPAAHDWEPRASNRESEPPLPPLPWPNAGCFHRQYFPGYRSCRGESGTRQRGSRHLSMFTTMFALLFPKLAKRFGNSRIRRNFVSGTA
jgi:hypothetical protein